MNKEELLKLEKEEIIDILFGVIEKLTLKVAELEVRLNQNSKNSSNPPSSDKFGKPTPKSLRKPSGKKPGGQKGHKGNGLRIVQEPDQYIEHHPIDCIACPKAQSCMVAKQVDETRYSIDIKIETETTVHQTLYVLCPKSNRVIEGEFPKHITGTIQYGVNLEALAISLNVDGAVSINRTHEILSSVFNIPISTGTISHMVSDCAKTVQPRVNEIQEAVMVSPIIHNDETGTHIDKKTHWAHVAATALLTYIAIHTKRGREAMDAIGVLLNYCGTAIHDCLASYFTFESIRHGLCNAHLLRELTAVVENTKQKWAEDLIGLLLEMKGYKEKRLEQNKHNASPQALRKYVLRYHEILVIALAENPVLPKTDGRKPKRGKTGALADRLLLRKDGFLLFFTDFSVPFDNNQAERDIRMFKTKQKVSGGFRTVQGAKDYATIMSFTSTARKHGISAFTAIRDALLGSPFSVKSVVTTE